MTRSNPLRELRRFGVSIWFDNISRALLKSGELARLIEQDGVRGVTSNPTIFEKAIGQSQDYDGAIERLAKSRLSPPEIFEALAIEDIRAAADLLRPVYEESKFTDGFVSLEVSPELARDARATHEQAVRLHGLVGRPNVMIKIPGTKEGLAAIAKTIEEGIPVNVTLLFSQDRYGEVVEAYLTGLERRAAAKKDLSRLASVASFFVSRVDTAVDAQVSDPALQGQAAVANAKLAYQTFKKAFSSARFAALRKSGAQVQRLLWASTGTKNPKYSDVLYVEGLIGPDTVNTVPPATLEAFRDHGACRPSLEDGVDEARALWEKLGRAVDLDAVMAKLEDEGVKAFAKSFETLMGQIAAKKELLQAEAGVVDAGLAELKAAMFSTRLWAKDPSLWKQDKEHQRIIKNSLGWLAVPDAMAAGLGQIRAFVSEIKAEGFEAAVVLGMGGSSLACEVFRACFARGKGHPRLEVLDTTHPAAVASLEARLKLEKTLFIVSSKSGSTIEPKSFMEYFFARCEKAGGKAGRRFVAITDPGTPLEKLARSRGFRKVFLNPSDIGGRYSALSYFGLVPAALMGVDVAKLLERARETSRKLSPSAQTDDNPALRLGAALGRHARGGQDKLTLWLPPALESFGLWIEQLIAESTGKEGKGIVPVCGEPPRPETDYGGDRLFAHFELASAPQPEHAKAIAELEKAGHPAIALPLADAYDLGRQFLIWEVATAAAGFLLGVDPFDQPNVQSAKDQTKKLLGSLEKGALAPETARLRAGNLAGFCDEGLLKELAAGRGGPVQVPLGRALGAHFGRLKEGDYAAILAYVEPGADNAREIEALAAGLRRMTRAPVSVEYGPRYLHSTGQLYKGGPGTGLFLQLVDDGGPDLPVPGEGFSFATLLQAQARGDFAAALAAGRRILRLHLGPAGSAPLRALSNAVLEAPARAK